MKKSIIILPLALFILTITLLTGCSLNPTKETHQEYKAYFVSVGDSADLSGETPEFPLWSTDALFGYADETAKKSASITFDGNVYTGDYRKTNINTPNTNAVNKYFGGNCFFELDSQSGELTSFLLAGDFAPEFYINEEEGREIADKFAEKYINLSEYKVACESNAGNIDCVYYFTYYREVDGMKTNDTLSITLNGRGRVVAFSRGMIGSFANTRAMIDDKKAELVLHEQLSSAYERYADKTFTIKDKTLVKLPDGKQGLLYRVETEIIEPSDVKGETLILNDGIKIFVVNN